MKQQLATLLVIATAFFTTASHAEGVAVTETGDSIPYMTYGAGETTLVLVHGWTNNRTFWEPHIPGLSDRYQVVTLDLASFGESLVKRNDWSMRSFAMDIDAVLGQVKAPKVVLVGFSMGGAPVIELAALGREEIIGIVLVDTFNDVEWKPSDKFIEDTIDEETRLWGDEASIRPSFSEGASETLVRRYISRTPETVPDVWWESIRQLFLWQRQDFRSLLPKINVPITAINSTDPPTTVEAWRRYVPGFKVHYIQDVGHLGVIWEHVDEFDSALISYVEDFHDQAQDRAN